MLAIGKTYFNFYPTAIANFFMVNNFSVDYAYV